MISYKSGGWYTLLNMVHMTGSVFPQAIKISTPCCMICVLFVWAGSEAALIPELTDETNVMLNNAIWGGFSTLVGFLVVFRTSQAYSRFWEGATSTHKMGAEWFDSCSSLMAFCKHSPESKAESVLAFQNTLVRLFSMLHAAALGEIEDCGEGIDAEEIEAFNMELIDAQGIDERSLRAIRDSDAKVELIFQWIQQLVVENLKHGVLTIPPPILSRSFQEIANGMVHFHDAIKISNVPFPFPYAQTCDCLLLLHWALVPFVVAVWVKKMYWAGIFCFVQVFTLWTLELIAVELENPFGMDPNDIDGAQMQLEMNNHLRLLLCTETLRTPSLTLGSNAVQSVTQTDSCVQSEEYKRLMDLTANAFRNSISFREIWDAMADPLAETEITSGTTLMRRFTFSTSVFSLKKKKKRMRDGIRQARSAKQWTMAAVSGSSEKNIDSHPPCQARGYYSTRQDPALQSQRALSERAGRNAEAGSAEVQPATFGTPAGPPCSPGEGDCEKLLLHDKSAGRVENALPAGLALSESNLEVRVVATHDNYATTNHGTELTPAQINGRLSNISGDLVRQLVDTRLGEIFSQVDGWHEHTSQHQRFCDDVRRQLEARQRSVPSEAMPVASSSGLPSSTDSMHNFSTGDDSMVTLNPKNMHDGGVPMIALNRKSTQNGGPWPPAAAITGSAWGRAGWKKPGPGQQQEAERGGRQGQPKPEWL